MYGFSQLSLMKEVFSLSRIFYAAECKSENEETMIFFSAPQVICNSMLAKSFHLSVLRLGQMTSTEFWKGDLRSHQPQLAVPNPVAKPITKYANISAMPEPGSEKIDLCILSAVPRSER